jgi:hypothetical protein
VSHRCKTDWYRLNALKLSSATLACARAAPFEIACPEWVNSSGPLPIRMLRRRGGSAAVGKLNE